MAVSAPSGVARMHARPTLARRAPREGGVNVPEIQRSRLLAAAVDTVDRHGYAEATVARITEYAGVSRRTFYELFENCEQCLAGVLDSASAQIEAEIASMDLVGLAWRERIRLGLWAILSYLDREPALARVCVVQSQRAGHEMLGRREAILEKLVGLIDQGRSEDPRHGPGKLAAQGIVGAVLAIVHGRLADSPPAGLRQLHGELMGIVVLPYLGPRAARSERERESPAPVEVPGAHEQPLTATLESVEPLAKLPMRLTYRTACVLQDLAEHPGSSNRDVAERVGVSDQGQISKLLTRLTRIGLLVNGAEGAPAKGERNQWTLTPTGETVTRSISAHARLELQGDAA